MATKVSIKLHLIDHEKKQLRSQRLKIADLSEMSIDDMMSLIDVSLSRAKELYGLAEFQKLPSIGIKFAEDLVSMGYYKLDQLKGKTGAALFEEYERQKGYWVDPCVEDQFRLVIYYTDHPDEVKTWWDFTAARKAYRSEHGYPKNRPEIPWHEVIEIKRK